jgi:hypothetical protein
LESPHFRQNVSQQGVGCSDLKSVLECFWFVLFVVVGGGCFGASLVGFWVGFVVLGLLWVVFGCGVLFFVHKCMLGACWFWWLWLWGMLGLRIFLV